MKKIASVISVIIMLAAICLPAFSYSSYINAIDTTLVVSNKDGAYCVAEYYDGQVHDIPLYKEFTIPYGTQIGFTGEYRNPDIMTENNLDCEGILYAYGTYDDPDSDTIWNVYINSEDVEFLQKTVGPTAGEKKTFTDRFVVMDLDGAPLYSGPSRIYDVVTILPYKAQLNVNYVDSFDDYGVSNFGYVSYTDDNGKTYSGWIFSYPYSGECAFAKKIDETSYISDSITVMKDGVFLFDVFDSDGSTYKQISDDIPIGTELKCDYFMDFSQAVAVHTTYNGKSGWIYVNESYTTPTNSNAIYSVNDICYSGDKMPIYKTPGNDKSATGKYLPANHVLNLNAMYKVALEDYDEDESSGYIYWLKLEYEGEEYWTRTDGSLRMVNCDGTYDAGRVYGNSVTAIYSLPDDTSEMLDTMEYGDEFTAYFFYTNENDEDWDYVSFNGTCGWVQDTSNLDFYGSSYSHSLRFEDGSVVRGIIEDMSKYKSNSDGSETETEETTAYANNGATVNKTTKRISEGLLITIAIIGVLAAAGTLIAISLITKKRDKKTGYPGNSVPSAPEPIKAEPETETVKKHKSSKKKNGSSKKNKKKNRRK